MDCVSRADGSTFRQTHQTPLFQNGVALPDFTHRLARLGVVGMSGWLFWSTTGTKITISHLSAYVHLFDIASPNPTRDWAHRQTGEASSASFGLPRPVR